jgi:hypothetical protein
MRHTTVITVLAILGLALGGGLLLRAFRRQPDGSAAPPAAVDEAMRDGSRRDIPVQKTPRAKKKLALAAVLAAACVAVGIAWAAWNVSGSGSGYAKAGSASALTLGDASASTSADLYPGATGSVKVSITNPNSFPVRVTTVTGTATITSDKGAACNASTGVSFTNQTGLTLDLAAGATNTFTLAGSVSMNNSSDNSCQGAVFTIPVSVSGTSNA